MGELLLVAKSSSHSGSKHLPSIAHLRRKGVLVVPTRPDFTLRTEHIEFFLSLGRCLPGLFFRAVVFVDPLSCASELASYPVLV